MRSASLPRGFYCYGSTLRYGQCLQVTTRPVLSSRTFTHRVAPAVSSQSQVKRLGGCSVRLFTTDLRVCGDARLHLDRTANSVGVMESGRILRDRLLGPRVDENR
jgi:hypothetical protein